MSVREREREREREMRIFVGKREKERERENMRNEMSACVGRLGLWLIFIDRGMRRE